ncbi:PIG-L family deacetylase [Bacillus sp. IITD106]|nr:PIG-L family deacetylase [Bacillus sp. IITD106]
MILKNKLVKNILISIIEYSAKSEKRIKNVEYVRGLYRYPKKMLGRKLPIKNITDKTDVLVFAAHPDDDVLGLGTTLYRHSLKNDNTRVVFVTNGSGRDGESWNIRSRESKRKTVTRYQEAVNALSLINIPDENIYCLGYPDGGTQRYLKNMVEDIFMLIQELNPRRIYVHCIEGGHNDHDLSSFVVKSVCSSIGYSNIFEWTEYNPVQPLGAHKVKFLPTKFNKSKTVTIQITDKERELKRQMLACHESQDVEQFYLQGEAIRKAKTTQVEKEIFEYCQIPKTKLQPIIKEISEVLAKIPSKAKAV